MEQSLDSASHFLHSSPVKSSVSLWPDILGTMGINYLVLEIFYERASHQTRLICSGSQPFDDGGNLSLHIVWRSTCDEPVHDGEES